jgi:hypothetical protein
MKALVPYNNKNMDSGQINLATGLGGARIRPLMV